MSERGPEVDNLLVSLLLAGRLSPSDDTLCEASLCVTLGRVSLTFQSRICVNICEENYVL